TLTGLSAVTSLFLAGRLVTYPWRALNPIRCPHVHVPALIVIKRWVSHTPPGRGVLGSTDRPQVGESSGPASENFDANLRSKCFVGVLALVYMFNFLDRSVFNILTQQIKTDLKLTDTGIGILGGIAFAALYAVMGIPIARLAERLNRVVIISVAL